MIKIRLQRHGAKHAPFYRMVVTEVTAPRDGRFIEILGTYDPQCHAREDELNLKMERIDHWLGVGAQPTDTARSLIRQGRMDPEAWLARTEKMSQGKAARRLKSATAAPSMDDSNGDAPQEEAVDSPAEEPAAVEEAVVSEESSEAPVSDDNAAAETKESEDSPVEEQSAKDEEPVSVESSEDSADEKVAEEAVSEDEPEAESSDEPAEDDSVSDTPEEASPDQEVVSEESSEDSADEKVAEEAASEDEPEAESSDEPAEDNSASDAPEEASPEEDTASEEESDGGGEEEKSKD